MIYNFHQKRNIWTNIRLISIPIVLCLLLVVIQILFETQFKDSTECGCGCIDTNGDGQCERTCGLQFSSLSQAANCPIPSPPEWPPLLQIPAPEYRAVRTSFLPSKDLPNASCRNSGSCPATTLLTGSNQSLGESTSLSC